MPPGDSFDESTLDRATLLRRLGVAAAALSLPALAGAAGASASADSFIKPHPKWRFVFVNHADTNPFFVPTQYGVQDACSLLGCTYQWTGSATGDVGQEVDALNSAIAAKPAGIAVSVIDKVAFEKPIQRALDAGIPVVSYNADGAESGPKARLAYIGQDLYQSGIAMGQRIVTLVPKGDVVIFNAQPGALNLQPRVDGALAAIKQSGKPVNAKVVTTAVDITAAYSIINSYYLGHKSVKGMFAVRGEDTQNIGQIIQKYGLRSKGVAGGGYDLLPKLLQLLDQGQLDFTIDQQPYLQGFYPVLQLFLYRYSSGLLAPSNTNTGLLFVTKANVKPYLTTKTRYEGSSIAQKFPVS
jgi:simple sugar transport system substrate-binding protein